MNEAITPDKVAEKIGEESAGFRGSKQTTFGGLVVDGILAKNPVFVLALSLCPAVAVTNSVKTSLAMGLAVLFVMSFNNLFTSLFRYMIHPKVRMPSFILLIATLVTTTELFMSAFFPALYQEMGVYLKLVVVFAIILARAEVFASKNPPVAAFMDGFGMGLGFLGAMVVAGVVREVLGTGTFWGYPVFGSNYQPILMIVLAPGGFITIGLLIALFRTVGEAKEKARAKASTPSAQGTEAAHA
jgi:electron transport complex protein RnfE